MGPPYTSLISFGTALLSMYSIMEGWKVKPTRNTGWSAGDHGARGGKSERSFGIA